MSNRCKVLVVLALVVAARSSPAADNGPLDAQQFLKDNGLAEYHAMCVEFVSDLASGKPETAAEVLIKSMPARASEENRDAFRKLIIRASPLFSQGAQDMEFIGFCRVSSRLIAMYYVVHVNSGPVLLRIVAYRNEGGWHTQFWTVETGGDKILGIVREVTHFRGITIIPLPDRKHSKRTARPARGRDGDRSMVSAAVDSQFRNCSPKNGPVPGRATS
jgi:hypothetical protein